MMKNFLVSVIAFLFFAPKGFSNTDSLLRLLNKTIAEAHIYDNQKIQSIDSIRRILTLMPAGDVQKKSELYEALYKEYKLFNYDSAYLYGNKLLRLAYNQQDAVYIVSGKLKMSFVLLSSGLFKEAYDSLSTIHISECPDPLKAEYYTLLGRYYYDLGSYDYENNYSVGYDIKGCTYIDSALMYYNPSSFEYNYYKGLKFLKQSKGDSAFVYFSKLLMWTNLSYHEEALTASTMSGIYLDRGNTEKGTELLALAAIADIKGSIKETFASFDLAELLYKKGDLKYASSFIENAIANANAYGARQRKAEVSGILPLIEKQRLDAAEGQNRVLILYGIAVTILLITLLILILFIRRQVKKLREAKKIITEAHLNQQQINRVLDETVRKLEDLNIELEKTNQQLENANLQLAYSNMKLEEANIIKEECVSYFFTIDSEFFTKLEKLKMMLEKRIGEKKFDEVRYIVNNINLRQEKEILLQGFDKVFLRIYPNFVNSFNGFFKAEDKMPLPEKGLLNSDLRIFALIRMGISDIDKIARILGYSVNTIYAYKSKIKNKSIIPNNEFEERLMNIN